MGSSRTRHKLVARPFDLCNDYAIIQKWWKSHGSFPPEPHHLSTTGIIVEESSQPICAGWLYDTDSKISVFEFVIASPDANRHVRDASLTYLIDTVKNIASSRGYALIYSSVRGPKYIQRLLKAGFIQVDTGQTHMFYAIDHV